MSNFLAETNLAITNFQIDKKGELTDLEINGKNVDLGTADDVHLYAWKSDNGFEAYTTSPNPKVNDTAIMADPVSLTLDNDPILTVAGNTITVFSTVFTRDTDKDITF